ncbi:MAG: putative metal-binding motif-containing protein [Sandaracinaceae bacterium]
MNRLPLMLMLLCAGCSAVVEGIAPPTCAENDDCIILNELEGIGTAACLRYQCDLQTDLCALGVRDDDRDGLIAPECAAEAPDREVDCNDALAGGEERCNGVDDDCDGVIDEQFVPAPTELLFSVTGANPTIGFGARPNTGELAIAHVAGGGGTVSVVSGTTATDGVALSYRRTSDLTSLTNSDLEEGCHTLASTGDVVAGACGFVDTDVAPTSDSLFYATVSTGGCGAGQLRVGYGDRAAAASEVIDRGPARRSSVYVGVDVDTAMTGDLPCTGASRTDGAPLGAARPSVGATEAQALVAFLADRAERDACGGTSVDVEVLGLSLMTDTFGGSYGWVTGSNEGQPQVVGQTTGGGRPGVGVWDGVGYVVAWGNDDAIELAFVETIATPPAYDRDGEPDSRVGQETAALSITSLGSVMVGGPADDVVVEVGSIRDGGIDLGVAWREGCGTGTEAVRFQQLFLTRSGSDFGLDAERAQDARPLASASVLDAPTIAYTFAGLIAEGIAREDGRPTGMSENDGGWVVAWAEGEIDASDRAVFAARLSEADGNTLGEPYALDTEGTRSRRSPALYRLADDRIAYAFFATDSEMAAYRGGVLTCLAE